MRPLAKQQAECGPLFLKSFYLEEVTKLGVTEKYGDHAGRLPKGSSRNILEAKKVHVKCEAFRGVWIAGT